MKKSVKIRTGLALSIVLIFLSGRTIIAETPDPTVIAGENKKADSVPIVLERADKLRNTSVGNETIKELIGNVFITRGDMGIECQHAYHYQTAQKIVFIRDVHYSDSLRDMWAEKVIYYVDTDSLEAIGSVKIEQGKYQGFSRIANYSEAKRKVYLTNDVKLIHREESTVLTGDQGFGDETMKYARVTGERAELAKIDSAGKAETTIFAKKIEYFDSLQIALATDSVDIMHGEITGYCELLTYYNGEDKALMEVDPVLMRDLDEIKGDSIYLYFADENLNRIEIFGRASVISPVVDGKPGQFNQMYGQEMYVNVVDDKMTDITVVGSARSIYYVYEDTKDKGKKYKGANSASGDKIFLIFSDGELETIHVAGGTEGTYYPSDYAGEIE